MDRRQVTREYKESARPMGVWRVRHVPSGKWLVGSSPNVEARLNRVRFELDHGSHPSRELQQEWKRSDPADFAFETLDRLEPPDDDPGYDPAADLKTLEAMWRERLTATDGPGY